MALIIEGKTRCAACGQVIQAGDLAAGSPHFTADPSDPLHKFTDSGLHRACWDALPERAEVERRVNALDKQHEYPPRLADRNANPAAS